MSSCPQVRDGKTVEAGRADGVHGDPALWLGGRPLQQGEAGRVHHVGVGLQRWLANIYGENAASCGSRRVHQETLDTAVARVVAKHHDSAVIRAIQETLGPLSMCCKLLGLELLLLSSAVADAAFGRGELAIFPNEVPNLGACHSFVSWITANQIAKGKWPLTFFGTLWAVVH